MTKWKKVEPSEIVSDAIPMHSTLRADLPILQQKFSGSVIQCAVKLAQTYE